MPAVIADLLPVRLVWQQGHGGVARMHGVQVRLTAPPDIGCGPLLALDYVPGELATVQTKFEAERDMHPHEKAAAARLLQELTGGAK